MIDISAKLVKELRDITGAGMMDCKKALVESKGDIETAIDILRKSGIAKAAKKLDREANDGRIEAGISNDGNASAMLLLAAETDFVAKNELFIQLANDLVKLSVNKKINSVENLLNTRINEQTVEDEIKTLIAKVGENIDPKRITLYETSPNGILHYYIHPGNKVGVMLELETENENLKSNENINELAHELAMQIAFSKPLAISSDEIDTKIIEKEKEIYRELAIQEGKPEKAIEKIVEGRTSKFLEKSCLLSQEYIRDSDITCGKLIEKISKEIGSGLKIRRFVRYEISS